MSPHRFCWVFCQLEVLHQSAGIVGWNVQADTQANSLGEPSICSPLVTMPCCGHSPTFCGGVSRSPYDWFLCGGGNSDGGLEVALGGQRASCTVGMFHIDRPCRWLGFTPSSVFTFFMSKNSSHQIALSPQQWMACIIIIFASGLCIRLWPKLVLVSFSSYTTICIDRLLRAIT